MPELISIAQIGLSSVCLWKGADWIVDSSAALARRLAVSELVIGLTVVAMGTSLPEFLVTLTAAFKGYNDISLSNIVGSNVFNLGIILGLMALFRPLSTQRTLIWETIILLGITVFINLAANDLVMGPLSGVVLLVVLAGSVTILISRSQQPPELKGPRPKGQGPVKDLLFIALGFFLVAFGGNWLVEGASSLARSLGLSEWVIGVTIVAAGTSLPEATTCLQAALKGKNDMLVGNLLGSDIFNFTAVLGLTCILSPLHISSSALPSLQLLVLGLCLLLVFSRTGWRITRLEGALLLLMGLGRWALDIL